MVATQRPLWRTVRDARMSTERLLKTLGLLYPPVDVEALAKRLGVRLHFVPALQWSGAIDSLPDEAHLYVKASEPRQRQRFTIAHELGHLFLHPLGTAYRDETFAGSEMESQANGFAAALLMPLWMMEAPVRRLDGDPQRLADLFDVSRRAMEIRLLRFYGHQETWDGNF